MNERDILTFQVARTIFAIPSGVLEMYLDPDKALLGPPPGSSKVVIGVLKMDDVDITILDLRKLFGTDESMTTKPGWLVLTYGGRRYGLVVDGFEDPVHLDKDADPQLVEKDFPFPYARPYLVGVLQTGAPAPLNEVYLIDLSRVLAPETLMVN